jgi:hypothetical protein
MGDLTAEDWKTRAEALEAEIEQWKATIGPIQEGQKAVHRCTTAWFREYSTDINRIHIQLHRIFRGGVVTQPIRQDIPQEVWRLVEAELDKLHDVFERMDIHIDDPIDDSGA